MLITDVARSGNERASYRQSLTRSILVSVCLSLILSCNGCTNAGSTPATVIFMDPEWSHDQSPRTLTVQEDLQEFTLETGIRVVHLPAPETSQQQLALSRELLGGKNPKPDVYGIDIVWPGMLHEDLLDLKPYLQTELASMDQNLVAAYTVNGEVVAAPYHTNVGVLFYSVDLLHKYGFHEPPQTWEELEQMALRIQEGERSAGRKDFWGFVWPGAASESLMCLTLEWQMSEGAGHIIESDGSVSINNPGTVRAWERAKRWVGWISPPSITSYEEWDAINSFHNVTNSAFARGWTSDYFLNYPVEPKLKGKLGVTSIPAGRAGRFATIGGFGLGVSRTSEHPREAVAFVRFMLRKEAELEDKRKKAGIPASEEFYRLPSVLQAFARPELGTLDLKSAVVSRPAAITGNDYDAVSRAVSKGVHEVLTGQATAPDTAARLESYLSVVMARKSVSEQTGSARIQ